MKLEYNNNKSLNKSHVLVNFDDGLITLVLNDHIESVEELVESTNELASKSIEEKLADLFRSSTRTEAGANTSQLDNETVERRNRLVTMLQKHRLPVKLVNDNSVINILDTVYINSPYLPENCESSNEIILNRVRDLVNCLN